MSDVKEGPEEKELDEAEITGRKDLPPDDVGPENDSISPDGERAEG
jgi:hypothetical protein